VVKILRGFLTVLVVVLVFVLVCVTVRAEGEIFVFMPLAFRGRQATATPTATVEPTATSTAKATAIPTATPLPRRETGEGNSLVFSAGEAVYGWKIVLLPSGRTCDGGLCWLPVAPEGGIVTSGVINPWSEEIPPEVTPWVPN